MYIFITVLLGAVCLFNILSIIGKKSSSLASWVAPFIFLFIFLVHVLLPILKYDHMYYRWATGYPSDVAIPQALVMVTAGLFLTAALHMRLGRMKAHQIPEIVPSPSFNAFIFCTYLAGLAFALNDLRTISQLGGVDVYLTDRIGSGEERGFIRTFGVFMMTGIISYVFVNCRNFTFRRGIILAAMLAFPLYYYTTLTSRNSITLLLLLMTGAAFISRSITISFNGRFMVAALGLIAVLYVGTSLITEATENRRQGRVVVADDAWLRSADGAFGNDEALLFRAMMPDPELALGKTYAAAAVAWVPRALWEGKPTGGGPFLVNMIYPGKYVVGATGNTSYTTGMFVEAVLNFGVFGFFLVPLVWVMGIAWFVRRALMAQTVESQLIWIIVTLMCSTAFVYMELLGFIARVGVMLLPLLIWVGLRKFHASMMRSPAHYST